MAVTVSVGIVTYNRAHLLKRAVQSVLDQSYPHIEIIVSDDNSQDNTEDVVRDLSVPRNNIRYIKRTGVGMTQNFVQTLQDASGTYFLWLCDDDYIAPNYVELCVAFLQAHPEYSLTCGTTKFFSQNGVQDRYEFLALESDVPQERVASYLRHVNSNVILYGLMRRTEILSFAYPDTFGADLLWSAQVAFAGKVKILATTFFYYSVEGISQQTENLRVYYNSTKERRENPYLTLRKELFELVTRSGPVFQRLGFVQRWRLAIRLWFIVRERFCMPAFEAKLRGSLQVRTRLKKIFE